MGRPIKSDPRVTGIDALSRAGAHELADRVRAFWEMRACRVSVWVEQDKSIDTLFVVRSNMVGGIPVAGGR